VAKRGGKAVKLDGMIRRHGSTQAEIDAWLRETAERQDGPGWSRKPRIVCPWCPHSIEDHDDDGCDVVIEVAGYEYICNCGQTPAEIREVLKSTVS
jgi:hypothetical protein